MKHLCLMCNGKMVLNKSFPKHKGKQNSYRVRRFQCSLCDYSELITADGSGDLNNDAVLEDVKNYYKQEENNRL